MPVISPNKPYRVGRSRTGLGLFATKPIKKGAKIVRYFGPLLDSKKKKDDAIENKYLFELNNRWTIDGSVRENVARYINHACKPNAESDVRPRKRKVIIRAIKNIEPGDEINYDYGTDYFKAYLKPIGCKCDACEKKRKKKRAEARAERLLEKAKELKKAERKAKKKAEKEAAKRAKTRSQAKAKAKSKTKAKATPKAKTKPRADVKAKTKVGLKAGLKPDRKRKLDSKASVLKSGSRTTVANGVRASAGVSARRSRPKPAASGTIQSTPTTLPAASEVAAATPETSAVTASLAKSAPAVETMDEAQQASA